MAHSSTPTRQIDLSLLKYRATLIQPINGDQNHLNYFLSSYDEFIRNYVDPIETCNDSILISTIKTKLIDRALVQLGTKPFLTWGDFREELKSQFSDGK